MRGQSQPFGFAVYNEKNEVVVEIEDLCSLVKSFGALIGILLLIEVTQQIILQTVLFALAFICLVRMAHEQSEWHAIEHKFIYLLENELPLTVDNVEKAPMKHKRCGWKNKFLHKPSTRKVNMALQKLNKNQLLFLLF